MSLASREGKRARSLPTRLAHALASVERLSAAGASRQSMLNESVQVVARALDAPLCKLLELAQDHSRLLVSAGVGWQPGVVGVESVAAGRESQPGYALQCQEPVVFDDLSRTSRFTEASLARRHGIISSACVPIVYRTAALGVLCVHDTTTRRFSRDEIQFLSRVVEPLARILVAPLEAADAGRHALGDSETRSEPDPGAPHTLE